MGCEEILSVLQFLLVLSTILNSIFVYVAIKKFYKERQIEKMWEEYNPDPVTLTCYSCSQRDMCAFVDDPYNTQGDCLAYK